MSDDLTKQVGGTHYSSQGIQPITYIQANDLGFEEGNVVKYVTRWKKKDGIKDLQKARQYIDFLISKAERESKREPASVSSNFLALAKAERLKKRKKVFTS